MGIFHAKACNPIQTPQNQGNSQVRSPTPDAQYEGSEAEQEIGRRKRPALSGQGYFTGSAGKWLGAAGMDAAFEGRKAVWENKITG